MCCKKINLAPANLGRLIRACGAGTNERKTSSRFLCNLSDFTLGEETIRLLSKGLTFIPKPRIEKRVTLRRGVEDFIRKLRLKYVFRNRDKPVPELYRRTGYDPGTTESQVLERFITTLRETRQTEPDRQPNTGVCHTGDGGETILTPLYQQSSGPSNFTCTTSCHLVYERAEMN